MDRKRPSFKMGPIILDCGPGYAGTLAQFYSKLLEWKISHPAQNGTAAITSPAGSVIAFQETDSYQAPIWPWQNGKQGQMLHFDLLVDDLDAAVAYAIKCGAKLADEKFFDDSRTLFDPAGHPFCVDTHHLNN